MPGELITENVESRFKELKNYWAHMSESSALVQHPSSQIQKMTKFGNMRPGITRQAPSFYHPLFEKINLQLPTKTREINQWTRHFYKCMTADSEILMADGTVKWITDVEIGEKVITHNGTEGVVNEVFEKEISDELYIVRAKGIQSPLKVTKQHPFYILREEQANCIKSSFSKTLCKMGRWKTCNNCSKSTLGQPIFVEAKNLRAGDYVLYPIYKNCVDQSDMNTNRARILGYYIAEGSMYYGKGYETGMRFSLGEHEHDIINEIGALIKEEFGVIGHSHFYGKGCIDYAFYSKELVEFLKKYCSGKATTKKFSSLIIDMNTDILKNILGAYLNGDGYKTHVKNQQQGQLVGVTASKNLANQLILILRKCGLICKKYEQKTSAVIGGEKFISYQIIIPPKYAKELESYSKFEIEKKEKYIDHHIIHNNYMMFKITKIEHIPEYKGMIYNLNIDGKYNSFIANEMIVHNTDGIVGNLIDLHSEFPLTGMHLSCDDEKIKKFFEILFFDVLRGEKLLLDINLEYWKVANVFPFGEWDDDKKIWTRFVCLNPDFVEVEKTMLVGDPVLKLDPDDNMKRIVQSRQPREIYNQLAQIQGGKIVNLIARGEKIPLNQFRVSHIAYKLSPYETVGTPIMFRAFKALIYKDILRRVQIAIGERHITPIKVVKVGTDQIPATPEAVQAAKDAFDELSMDLSSWFFYHHAISFDYVSSAGKIQPLDREYDWIEKEITAALLGSKTIIDGSGPNFACNDEETETLTENGFKKWYEINEDEKIATFNPGTEELEYHYPISRHVYDYDSEKDGKMIQFKTGKIDICVTPNHRMFINERINKRINGKMTELYNEKWVIKRADEVKNRAKFRSQIKWQGKIDYSQEKINNIFNKEVELVDYLRLVAYYLSEGWVTYNTDQRQYRVGIRQMNTSKYYSEMKAICQNFNFRIYKDSFILNGKETERYFENEFGKGSANKSIPKWIKNLPVEYLKIFLGAIMMGDGHSRIANKKKPSNKKYHSYTTISKKLADDVYEIVYKIGFVPKVVKQNFKDHQPQYHIYWSDSDCGKFPMLHCVSYDIKTNKSTPKQCISKIDYKGKVYCFEVPNHLFITRRSGVVTIQGNTASVALRILINRYLRNQEILKDWVKNYVFRPVAIEQNFVRVNEWGDEEYIIPDIEFEFMNLKDDTQMKQLMKELMKMGVLSKQTFFSYIGLNYEKEQRIVAKEQEKEKVKKTPKVTDKKAPEEPMLGGEPEGMGVGMGGELMPEVPPAPAAGEIGPGLGAPGAEGIA